MQVCRSCSLPVSEDARYCSGCGSSLASDSIEADGPTRTVVAARAASRGAPLRRTDVTSAGRLLSSDSGVAVRFVPGRVLLERYRILGLIGRGGMGEVYRADDLRLDQPVALKFLPEALAADRGRQERFFQEVRIARQVSHPNVARVYDVGEVDGQPFLSMEYIDGEDLGTLLRRIGRLPGDKAVEIARQICAGLAAAHDRGVLHRDLKPANVMIDGRGRARITDFGLAAAIGDLQAVDTRSGTPHYMAPEQLEGREVTVRSDIYGLGLVLYELFTGRRAREAGSMAELMRLHQESTPASPSSLVAELDPLVERAILLCLEPDPADRPPSALAVAATLPGGDPLSAALAAGETPSPEAVAAAGGAGALRPAVAVACLAGVVGGFALIAGLAGSASLVGRFGVAKPPQALVERAREVVERLGHTTPPGDHAGRYRVVGDFYDWATDKDHPDRTAYLRRGGPPAIVFWYRESPSAFRPRGFGHVVVPEDPAPLLGGMRTVHVDTEGRLRGFHAVPFRSQGDRPPPAVAKPPDWSVALGAAGLADAGLRPAAPSWRPPVYADSRAAWAGTWPGTTLPLRVEAAGLEGKLVWFATTGPWSRPDAVDVGQPKGAQRVALIINVVLLMTVLSAASWWAWRNVHAGRGDRKGALRVASWIAGLTCVGFWLDADHSSDLQIEWSTIVQAVSFGLFFGAFVWVLYLALEPVVRRRAPESLIGWTRLLAGRWRDPRVGRDLLLGALAGMAIRCSIVVLYPLSTALGQRLPAPLGDDLDPLLGVRYVAADLSGMVLNAVGSALVLLFFFSLGFLGKGKPWVGQLVFFLFTAGLTFLGREGALHPALNAGFAIVAAGLVTLVYARLGVLAAASMLLFQRWPLPLTLDTSAWYAPSMLLAVALLLLIPAFGAWSAVGGGLRRRSPSTAA